MKDRRFVISTRYTMDSTNNLRDALRRLTRIKGATLRDTQPRAKAIRTREEVQDS